VECRNTGGDAGGAGSGRSDPRRFSAPCRTNASVPSTTPVPIRSALPPATRSAGSPRLQGIVNASGGCAREHPSELLGGQERPRWPHPTGRTRAPAEQGTGTGPPSPPARQTRQSTERGATAADNSSGAAAVLQPRHPTFPEVDRRSSPSHYACLLSSLNLLQS
jgi:hypothetical protein